MKKIGKIAVILLSSVLLLGLASCEKEPKEPAPRATYIGTKAPTAAKEVGDIVFNDGSAMPYAAFDALDNDTKAEKKTSAIALIFYKGTGLNSDDANGNADTTTVRTLGVGLRHNRNGLAWCIESADAYNKNITTIRCPASGDAGALIFTGDKNGSNNFGQIEDFEGVDDTTTEGNYPAFDFANNYKNKVIGTETVSRIPAESEFANGWYIPSIAELFQIYANGKGSGKVFDVEAASEALGGDRFQDSWYLTSTQYASEDITEYTFTFYDGSTSYANKIATFGKVCCIREF